ncbi:MAG: hypothetical protein ACJ8AW_50435 [Rhodopila sp.]
MLAGQASLDEITAAGLTALAGALLSVAVRLVSGKLVQASQWWLLPTVARALASVPKEVFLVGRRLLSLHPVAGQTQVEPLKANTPTARGIEIMATSFAPNRFVIALVQRDHVLIHTLAP